MSPRVACLLNLLILIVNFVLVCVHTETDVRVLRAATRAAAAPIPWRVSERRPDRANGDARAGAIGPIPHTRLLKFLALLEGAEALSAPQREAVYEALAHCCEELPRAAELVRASGGDPRAVRERVEHEVADRLRAAAIADDAIVARLVRVVVASAG